MSERFGCVRLGTRFNRFSFHDEACWLCWSKDVWVRWSDFGTPGDIFLVHAFRAVAVVRLGEIGIELGKGSTLDTASWLSIGLVCLAGASSPGPSLAVLVKNTVAGGRRQGVLTGIGHGLGVGIYAFGAVVGVAALVQTIPGVSRAIEAVGGLYLVWMGVGVLRHAGEATEEVSSVGGRTGFQEGFAIAFLNPKIAVFFLALLGSFLPADATGLELAGVAGLAMGIDAAWYVFAALMLVTTGAADWLAARGIWMDRILGSVLLAVGAFLLVF